MGDEGRVVIADRLEQADELDVHVADVTGEVLVFPGQPTEHGSASEEGLGVGGVGPDAGPERCVPGQEATLAAGPGVERRLN